MPKERVDIVQIHPASLGEIADSRHSLIPAVIARQIDTAASGDSQLTAGRPAG